MMLDLPAILPHIVRRCAHRARTRARADRA
jgi:hypothetical protein